MSCSERRQWTDRNIEVGRGIAKVAVRQPPGTFDQLLLLAHWRDEAIAEHNYRIFLRRQTLIDLDERG